MNTLTLYTILYKYYIVNYIFVILSNIKADTRIVGWKTLLGQ